MADLPFASRGADEFLAPGGTGAYAGTATSSSGAAASLSLLTKVQVNGSATGGAYFTFQARGGDVYIRNMATATTATTAGAGSNGVKIADGTSLSVWIDASRPYIDHIASGACTLFWWQSSPNYQSRF